MENYFQRRLPLFPALLFFVLGCGGEKTAPVHFDPAAIGAAAHRADTLPAESVFQIAHTLPIGAAQDTFYAALFEIKKSRFDVKGIREVASGYEKLRGGSIGAQILLARTLGLVDGWENQFLSAEKCYEKGLALSETARDSAEIVQCLVGLTGCKSALGKFDEGTGLTVRGIAIAEAIRDESGLAELRSMMARFLFENKDYDKSVAMHQLNIPYYQKVGDADKESTTYFYMGTAYDYKNDSVPTVTNYEKSLEIRLKLQIPPALTSSYGQFANFWLNHKDYPKALQAAEQAIFWNKKSQFRGMDGALEAILGEALSKNGDAANGEKHLLAALDHAKKHNNQRDVFATTQGLFDLYKAAGRTADALRMHEEYMTAKDSVYSQQKQRAISELNIKYETAEKQHRILELEQQQKTEQQQKIILALASLLALGFGTALVLRLRGRRRILEQQNQLLEKDKTLLAQEKELAEARETLKTQELERSQEAHKKTQRTLKNTKEELETTAHLLNLKNQLIEDLQMRLHDHQSASDDDDQNIPDAADQLFKMKILTDADWHCFRERFEAAFPGFLQQLRTSFPDLTPAETRLFLLSKLRFSLKEISETLGISQDSVYRSRQRLGKKLSLTDTREMDDFIEHFQ